MFMIRLLIITALSLSSVAFSATLDGKIDFLVLYKDYYNLSQKINLKHLSNYIECLHDENTGFTFKYLDQNANIIKKNISCSDSISTVFGKRLKSEYSKMRIVLALSKAGRREEKYIMSMSENINYKINVDIDHPNDTSMTLLPFNIEKPDPLSAREIKQAMRTYDRHARRQCEIYVQRHLGHELESQMLIKRLGEKNIHEVENSFCKDFNISEYAAGTHFSFREILRNYHRWLEEQRFEFRKKHLNLYYSLINKSPYFLLLERPSPSKDELLRALDTIFENASKRKQDFDDFTADNNIEDRITNYRSGLLSDSDKRELFQDLSHYVNDPLFMKFYTSFSEKLDEETKYEIDGVISSNELKDTVQELAIIVGGVASCFLPSQKLFKLFRFVNPLRSAKIFKLSCLTAVGVPLNSWFIYESLSKYEKGLSELLSSADGRYMIRKYNSTNKTDLILNTLFFASGVGAAKLLLKAMKMP